MLTPGEFEQLAAIGRGTLLPDPPDPAGRDQALRDWARIHKLGLIERTSAKPRGGGMLWRASIAGRAVLDAAIAEARKGMR